MACYYPMRAYRAKHLNQSGKRSITFNPSQGYKDLPLEVPCGQCIGCRLERSRQAAIKCVHETTLHEHSAFLTLTYSPESVPKHNSLYKPHFQTFMKDYRSWLGYHQNRKIRVFYCGEYGEKNDRPHYHAIIFGHDFHDKKIHATIGGNNLYRSKKLEQLWTHGFSTIGSATFESAAYVARYVTKKINGKKQLEHYTTFSFDTGEIIAERTPEFAHGSSKPGLGKKWFEKFHKDVYPSDEIYLRGKMMKPPKYYDRLHEKMDAVAYEDLKRARIAQAKKSSDNTYERLRVREKIQELNAQTSKRNYEK